MAAAAVGGCTALATVATVATPATSKARTIATERNAVMMRQGRTPSFVTRASSSPMEHVSVVSCSRSSRRFDMADEPCVRGVREGDRRKSMAARE